MIKKVGLFYHHYSVAAAGNIGDFVTDNLLNFGDIVTIIISNFGDTVTIDIDILKIICNNSPELPRKG